MKVKILKRCFQVFCIVICAQNINAQNPDAYLDKDPPEATALRFDNDVIDIDYPSDPHDWFPDITDPNQRFEVSFENTTGSILGEALNLANSNQTSAQVQTYVNDQLDQFTNAESENHLNATAILMIEEKCHINNKYGGDGKATFENLENVGLKNLSNSGILNANNESMNILNFLGPGVDLLFGNIKVKDPLSGVVKTIGSTCDDEQRDIVKNTNYFIHPAINSVTKVKIFDDNDELQVRKGLAVYDRFDDGVLCQEEFESSTECGATASQTLNRNKYGPEYFGVRNVVIFCPPNTLTGNNGIGSIRESLINEDIREQMGWFNRGISVKYHKN